MLLFFGGLGHLAVKIAHALKAKVTAITTTADKLKDARRLGAKEAVLSTDPEKLRAQYANSFDFMLSTVPEPLDMSTYLPLLKLDGVLCLVGIATHPHKGLYSDTLISQRRSIAGSLIGGIAETQEMLQFCADNDIFADIELISMEQVNQAFDNVIQKKVRYRYVVDMATF